MNYLFLFLAILLFSLQTVFFKCADSYFKKGTVVFFIFNFISSSSAFIFFILSKGFHQPKTSTVLLAAAYGAVYTSTVFSYIKALGTGPLSLTSLIFTSSLVLPVSASWLFWHETLAPVQAAGLIMVFITFIILSGVNRKGVTNINLKWCVNSILAFIGNGSLLIIVKAHQTITPGQDTDIFLIIAFGTTAVLSIPYIMVRLPKKHIIAEIKQLSFLLPSFGAGIATGLGSKLSIFLSGRMPGTILFPLLNGGIVILSIFAASMIFKERFRQREIIGIINGIIAILLLGLAP